MGYNPRDNFQNLENQIQDSEIKNNQKNHQKDKQNRIQDRKIK